MIIKLKLFLFSLVLPSITFSQVTGFKNNAYQMEFVTVPAGKIIIGKLEFVCPHEPDLRDIPHAQRWTAADYKACEDAVKMYSRPGFEVEFDASFEIGKYEVTQYQWSEVMRDNPSHFHNYDRPDSFPVESVSWERVQVFIQKLNIMDRSFDYRLPTEFEWEYSARAGAMEALSWSDTKKQAWIQDTNKGRPTQIGTLQPNAWGIYDMLGNVWEWVNDFHNGDILPGPIPPEKGEVHVLKGGSFTSDVTNATFFFHGGGPGNGWDVGFRLVRMPKK
jgi:formylglycine-generating enzyme